MPPAEKPMDNPTLYLQKLDDQVQKISGYWYMFWSVGISDCVFQLLTLISGVIMPVSIVFDIFLPIEQVSWILSMFCLFTSWQYVWSNELCSIGL